MNIGILDFSSSLESYGHGSVMSYELDLLLKSCSALGYEGKKILADECQMYFHDKKYEVFLHDEKFSNFDVIIPRVGLLHGLDLEVSILKQFQLLQVPVVNKYIPIMNAKNKLRTMQILSKEKISVPKTVVVRKFDYLDSAIEAIGGYPIILKAPFGSFGTGVVIVESRRSLHSAVGMLLDSVKFNFLMIQEYVEDAEGVDYRAFVVGDKVIASMKRTAKKGEFRSNINLGGEGSTAELTDKEKKLAVRAVKALNLQVGGVDFLRTKKGPVVVEVNANPGFKGLSKITGVDVSKEIIKYSAGYAKKRAIKKKTKSVKSSK